MLVREFLESDAEEVVDLIIKTTIVTNSKDYSEEFIKKTLSQVTAERFIQRSKWTHFYVVVDNNINKIIGCGAIGPYWDKVDESCLFNIFVLPEYQGMGVGKKIVETLESDEFFKRAKRIEVPASITALEFYKKMGYEFKEGITEIDEEGHYKLEKIK